MRGDTMGYNRIRGNLRREKKKLRKTAMNNLRDASYVGESNTEKTKKQWIELVDVKDNFREQEWAEMRRKLKPYTFKYEADEYEFDCGDIVTDTIKCTAFYEIDQNIPLVWLVDLRYDDIAETIEFGELFGCAIDKICEKVIPKLDIN